MSSETVKIARIIRNARNLVANARVHPTQFVVTVDKQNFIDLAESLKEYINEQAGPQKGPPN